MPEDDPPIGQNLADEQPAVAVIWLTLAAHDRNPMIGRSCQQSVHRLGEAGLLRHEPVKSVPLRVVVIVASRTASELLAEEEVANSGPAQALLNLLAVELRRESRVREGAHVDDVLDLLLAQKTDEFVELVIGVTN
jgi:hypothetical protein